MITTMLGLNMILALLRWLITSDIRENAAQPRDEHPERDAAVELKTLPILAKHRAENNLIPGLRSGRKFGSGPPKG